MMLFTRLALLVLTGTLFTFPHPTTSHPTMGQLTRPEQNVLRHAAKLAATAPGRAVAWLRKQPNVKSAALGPDHVTVDVHFQDGAQGAVLSPEMSAVRVHLPIRPATDTSITRAGAGTRAVVLEPFADELNLGADAGEAEANSVRDAGFSVDVLRNSQVSVEVMANLGQYAVVYWETHSGQLPGGDAVVMTGTTNSQDYPTLYADHSLLQAYVAGDPTMTLYNGITGHFVTNHMQHFAAGSLVFVNGCNLLNAQIFWGALQSIGVSTFLAWSNDVDSLVTEPDAQFLFGELAKGESVDAALQAGTSGGYTESEYAGVPAQLGYRGDGSETLSQILGSSAATPSATLTATATATATATPTPKPTVTPKPKHSSHKKPRHTSHPKKKVSACKAGRHRVHGKCQPIRHPKCTHGCKK